MRKWKVETEGVALLGCRSSLHSLAGLCLWSPLSPAARFTGRKHGDVAFMLSSACNLTGKNTKTSSDASGHKSPTLIILKSSSNYISSGSLCKTLPLRLPIHNAWRHVFGSWWHILPSSTALLYLGRLMLQSHRGLHRLNPIFGKLTFNTFNFI